VGSLSGSKQGSGLQVPRGNPRRTGPLGLFEAASFARTCVLGPMLVASAGQRRVAAQLTERRSGLRRPIWGPEPRAPDRVAIDLSDSHIWVASTVAPIGAITNQVPAQRKDGRDDRPEPGQRGAPRSAHRSSSLALTLGQPNPRSGSAPENSCGVVTRPGDAGDSLAILDGDRLVEAS
jgi:hypothetical protein